MFTVFSDFQLEVSGLDSDKEDDVCRNLPSTQWISSQPYILSQCINENKNLEVEKLQNIQPIADSKFVYWDMLLELIRDCGKFCSCFDR